jgi:hypothetical protein
MGKIVANDRHDREWTRGLSDFRARFADQPTQRAKTHLLERERYGRGLRPDSNFSERR